MGLSESSFHQLGVEEAVRARERFKTRIAQFLSISTEDIDDVDRPTSMAILARVNGQAAEKLSAAEQVPIPPHWVVVTHGVAYLHGREFLARFLADSEEDAKTIALEMARFFSLWEPMQRDSPFHPFEFAQTSETLRFWGSHLGDPSGRHGALILPEPILRGHRFVEGATEFDDEGPPYDADFLPRNFLLAHPLRPSEYQGVAAIRLRDFVPFLAETIPLCMWSADRPHFLHDEPFRSKMVELRQAVPQRNIRTTLDCLKLDLNVRKNGRAVDLVLEGDRFVTPVLNALEVTFLGASLPVGTVVSAAGEGHDCQAHFFCHDRKLVESGMNIAPETARFIVVPRSFESAPPQPRPVELTPELQRQCVLLPRRHLLEQRRLVARIEVIFMFPKSLLAAIVQDVRAAVQTREEMSDCDWDVHPLILQWPQLFHGTHPETGFLLIGEDRIGEEPSEDLPPAEFRFVIAGSAYFREETYIQDDGTFARFPPRPVIGAAGGGWAG